MAQHVKYISTVVGPQVDGWVSSLLLVYLECLAAAGRVEAGVETVVAVGADSKEAAGMPLLPGSLVVGDFGRQAADCRVVAAGLEQIAGNFDTASFVDKERLTRHCLYYTHHPVVFEVAAFVVDKQGIAVDSFDPDSRNQARSEKTLYQALSILLNNPAS